MSNEISHQGRCSQNANLHTVNAGILRNLQSRAIARRRKRTTDQKEDTAGADAEDGETPKNAGESARRRRTSEVYHIIYDYISIHNTHISCHCNLQNINIIVKNLCITQGNSTQFPL